MKACQLTVRALFAAILKAKAPGQPPRECLGCRNEGFILRSPYFTASATAFMVSAKARAPRKFLCEIQLDSLCIIC